MEKFTLVPIDRETVEAWEKATGTTLHELGGGANPKEILQHYECSSSHHIQPEIRAQLLSLMGLWVGDAQPAERKLLALICADSFLKPGRERKMAKLGRAAITRALGVSDWEAVENLRDHMEAMGMIKWMIAPSSGFHVFEICHDYRPEIYQIPIEAAAIIQQDLKGSG